MPMVREFKPGNPILKAVEVKIRTMNDLGNDIVTFQTCQGIIDGTI